MNQNFLALYSRNDNNANNSGNNTGTSVSRSSHNNNTARTTRTGLGGLEDLVDVSDLFSASLCCSDIYSNPYKTGSASPFIHHYRPHPPPQELLQLGEGEDQDPLRVYCQQQNSLVSDSSSSDSASPDRTTSNHKIIMTDPLNASGEAEGEDLDALLSQADSMISANVVIDGFAIDSDEDDDINNNNNGSKEDDEGVVDVSMESPTTDKPMNSVTTTGTNAPSMPVQPDPLLHPLHEDVVQNTATSPTTTTTPTNTNAFSAAAVTSAMHNLGVNVKADASVLESQLKAHTSKFAANMSSMAQRFARGTSGDNIGIPNNNNASASNMNSSYEGNIPPPMSVPVPSLSNTMPQTNNTSSNNSPYASQSNSQHGSAASSSSAASTAPGGVPMMNFELDAEQKTTLVEWHVRKLLPGERVIMFLHNLLHVSDSTGSFQYAAQPGSPIVWCCAMTYYRLIVFGTTQEVIMHVMNSAANGATKPGAEVPKLLQHPFTSPAVWNASCWPPAFATVMEVPLASMEKVEKTVYTASSGQVSPHHQARPTSLMGLQIWAKEGRVWRITTPSYADTLRAHQALLTYAFPGRRNLGYLFAFESKRADVVNSVVTDPATGQKTVSLALTRKRFDAVTEYQRQFNRYITTGNGNAPAVQPWKLWTQINAQYQLCMSYPNVLVGPASLDEHNPDAVRLLQSCAAFRSEQRLPTLAWGSGMDGASIWRCSQPKIGLQGNRSSADELVLKHIMEAAKSANALREQPLPVRMDAHLLQVFTGANGNDLANTHWVKESNCDMKILDLRPRSAAMANRTGGYGYENTSNYPGTTLQFCNIGNIHAVRDAYQKLRALCLNMSNSSDVSWGSALEDTKWLSHIRIILAASWETAFWVQVHRMPVLLHCSHGWDRTSQVSALAQIMLDPFYRTLEGFACLMEKDFMSFGHPFHTRCAHGEGKGGAEGGGGVHHQDASGMAVGNSSAPDEGQISPIFLQFLDCVWQIVHQYPECFEFTTDYLLELSDHIYSCRFGNMLCDTERERELVAGIRQRTYSLWDHLEQDPNDPGNDPRAKFWRNPHWDASPTGGGGVLLMPMPTLLRNVTLWKEKYARFAPKATQRWRNTEQSHLWQPRPTATAT